MEGKELERTVEEDLRGKDNGDTGKTEISESG